MILLTRRPRPGWYVPVQAGILFCVFVVLAVTPAPVTFPDGPWELAFLLKAAVALLVADVVLVGITEGRRRTKSRVRPLDEGTVLELRRLGHYHLVDSHGVVGVVDQVIADRDGVPRALIVSDGWLFQRRFLVPLDELRSIDDIERTITVDDRGPGSRPG